MKLGVGVNLVRGLENRTLKINRKSKSIKSIKSKSIGTVLFDYLINTLKV